MIAASTPGIANAFRHCCSLMPSVLTTASALPHASLLPLNCIGVHTCTHEHRMRALQGGFVSMGVLYPLDQVRQLKQTDDPRCRGRGTTAAIAHLAQTEGMAGLYRGFASIQMAMGVSNFVYFYCYLFVSFV